MKSKLAFKEKKTTKKEEILFCLVVSDILYTLTHTPEILPLLCAHAWVDQKRWWRAGLDSKSEEK